MRMIKIILPVACLFLVNSLFVFGQVTDPMDDALIIKNIDGWNIRCSYIVGGQKVEYIKCPNLRVSENGNMYHTGLFSNNSKKVKEFGGAPSMPYITFERVSDDRAKRIELIDYLPEEVDNRMWNFKGLLSGPGGNKANIYSPGLSFGCMKYFKPPDAETKATRAPAYCPEGSYNGQAKFKDTKTNRVYTLNVTALVKYFDSKPKYIFENLPESGKE